MPDPPSAAPSDAPPDAREASEAAARRIRALLGPEPGVLEGVQHVTAVWRPPGGGALVTLRIHDATPASPADRFVLGVARARAGAIVTTGRNLRMEPQLTHRFDGPGEPPRLAAWRRHALGLAAPPLSVVMTSGRELDFGHRIFRDGVPAAVFTSREGAERLADRAADAGVEVIAHPEPGLRALLEHLRAERGIRGIDVEAGATTSRGLYEPPLAVDELLLSVFEEPGLAESVRGPAFLEPGRLEADFVPAAPPRDVREPSGRWTFRRLLRR